MKKWIGKSGYVYKAGENELERLRNKLSTLFMAIETADCKSSTLKKGLDVIPDVLMHLEDMEEYFIKDDKYNRRGEIYNTNEGCKVEIIEYFNSQNCTIKFEDGGIKKNVKFSLIKAGKIKNVNLRSVQKVGFIGEGKYSFRKDKEAYRVWEGIIKRGYSPEYNKRESYQDVTVAPEWHNFQNFAHWFYSQTNYKPGFHLDKDILVKGNKIYSPETCSFVPAEVNYFFIIASKRRGIYPIGVSKTVRNKYRASIREGTIKKHLGNFDTIEEAFNCYKEKKENLIKELALKYKDVLLPSVFEAMLNYKIEITD